MQIHDMLDSVQVAFERIVVDEHSGIVHQNIYFRLFAFAPFVQFVGGFLRAEVDATVANLHGVRRFYLFGDRAELFLVAADYNQIVPVCGEPFGYGLAYAAARASDERRSASSGYFPSAHGSTKVLSPF